MKILALERELLGAAREQFQLLGKEEARAAWELYQCAIIRALYFRAILGLALVELVKNMTQIIWFYFKNIFVHPNKATRAIGGWRWGRFGRRRIKEQQMSTNQRTFNASYLPLILILLTTIILFILFLAGVMLKVIAWNLANLPLSIVAINGLVFTIRRWIFQKRLDPLGKMTGAAFLLALSPLLMIIYPLAYPASLQDTQPSVTVRLPAEVPLKVVWGGDTLAVNQHVVYSDQRWAYDLVVEPYLTGSSKVTDYGCYGILVVALAAGEVVVAHDGEPDMVPGESSNNYEALKGNHVAIRLDETGTYLVIAHLKPGSVTVAVGQRVTEGQVIGRCGNSGNTSEPHIHIHHQRQVPTIYPVNFAEGLPLYFRDLNGSPMPQGGISFTNDVVVATGNAVVYRKQP